MDPNQITSSNIMEMMLKNANTSKSYSDKLREERMAAFGNMNKAAATEFATPGVVPTNPMDRMGRENAFMNAASGFVAPVADAQKRTDDLMTQIYQLQQKDKTLEPTGPSLTEKLKALELGYTVDDTGNLVKMSSGDVDKESIKTWAQGVKNGTSKFTDVPEKYQQDVLKEMSSASAEISQSAKKAIGIIDELEKLNTGGITGKARWAWTDKARKAEGKLKQLNSELQIEESKRLKGQGSMSDAERAILANAVSSFNLDENGRSRLSDKDFKAELAKLKTGLSGQGSTTSTAYDENKLLDEVLGGK